MAKRVPLSLQEHREDERNQAEIAPHISALRDALAAGDDAAARAAVAALQRLVPAHLAFELRHLRHEEDHLSPLLRKNLSHKELRAVIGKVRRGATARGMQRCQRRTPRSSDRACVVLREKEGVPCRRGT